MLKEKKTRVPSKNRNGYSPSTLVSVIFSLNGSQATCSIPSSMLLIDLIREEFGLTGTKPGCREGECGACTVLVDGHAVNSCLYLTVNINGKEVTTIEGLTGRDGNLDPVQKAMISKGAIQCGFCTPGMVMSIKSLVNRNKNAKKKMNREEIKKSLEGNLCRCTGYIKIIDAAEAAITKMDEKITEIH
ncbi:MAG: (2Fe-2S)-binding protein [Bacteroidetes bacterium]|nr:(2Fe-2S)-binding protein [Bacteroidota bacterium]